MQLSVIVPTLNGRDQLSSCLDQLTATAPDAELIVVNGPSADGTTGMVRDRDDVDVLVEVSARTVNVARNAGIEVASGDVIAFVGDDLRVEDSWRTAIAEGLTTAPVVTGPTHRTVPGGMTTESPETKDVARRQVTYISGSNVAFEADVLDTLDGFDEYLETGGSRDVSHRLAGIETPVAWEPSMSVRCEYEADGGHRQRDWGWKYRALSYRLIKNYGIRPTIIRRTLSHALYDAATAARDVVGGSAQPTAWFGTGKEVVSGMTTGFSDGLVARSRDREGSRNPHGISKRADRAVARYDWRDSTPNTR